MYKYLIIFILLLVGCGGSADKGESSSSVDNHVKADVNTVLENESQKNNLIEENKNSDNNSGEYKKLIFKDLNSFRVVRKMSFSMFDSQPTETDQEKVDYVSGQIPETIKNLNGTLVEIQGYAVPLSIANGKAKDLVLMSVNAKCCFGDIVRPNDIIYVYAPNNKLKIRENQFVKIKGKLTVEPKMSDLQSFIFIYWMEAIEISPSKKL